MWRGISALQCIQGTTSEIFIKGVENGDFMMGLEKVSLKCNSQGQAGTPTKVKLWGNTTVVCLMSTFINELFGEDNRERDLLASMEHMGVTQNNQLHQGQGMGWVSFIG